MSGATSRPIRRIAVIRFGGMGDILLATPAVRAMAQHYNTDEIDFIVGKGMKPALTGIPYLRRIIEFDKRGGDARPANFLRFLADLRRQSYDLFVNFQPSIKTRTMALASGAPRVLTFKKDRRRQPDTGRVRHAVDDFTKELRPLGIARVEDRHLDFVVPAEATERVAHLLEAKFGIYPNDSLIVVNPAASHKVNRWPTEKFAAFFDRVSEEIPAVRLALTGGPGDDALAQSILEEAQHPERVANLCGRLSVKELGALLARANTFVTADTGPLHIASAVGTSLVCLFGAADPDRTGPLNPRDLVVVNPALSCIPCQSRTCARGDTACMRDLAVERVLESVRRSLRRSEARV